MSTSKNGGFLGHGAEESQAREPFPLPVYDLSGDFERHIVIERGTPEVYQGHPTTLLMPDQKTVFCVWTRNHGGPCGPLKRSDDEGRTWSDLLPVPPDWSGVRNCPVLFRLPDPQGRYRLFIYAGQGPDGCMHRAVSEDGGASWSAMESLGLACVMPFCAILPRAGGRELVGLTNLRRPGAPAAERTNVLAWSVSRDGGFTWSPWEIILDWPEKKFCEPWIVVSPDGGEWTTLIRENVHGLSYQIRSRDEGRTWSDAEPLPVGLAGDRHISRYAPDGRLVVVFRDRAFNSGTRNHFVAWVGRYEDLHGGGPGEFRVKLLHSHHGGDCGYPGLECFPDGTFLATTYIQYRPGEEKNSIVALRFHLPEFSDPSINRLT